VSDQDPLDRAVVRGAARPRRAACPAPSRFGFFWELLELLPAAEAAAGEFEEAAADVQRLSARVDDLTDSGRGEIAEQLRPFYLDYLRRRGARAERG
jgi:hypothetical protein